MRAEYRVYCRCKVRTGSSSSKDPDSPVFKDSMREGAAGYVISLCTIFRCAGIKENVKHHQPFGFNQSRIYMLVVAVSIWWGSATCRNYLGMCVMSLSVFSRDCEFGGCAMWLVYSLNCSQFPSPAAILFSYVFTFLKINSCFNFFTFNWSIITLLYCDGFCHTST